MIDADSLSRYLIDKHGRSRRCMVAIAGIPGSGKSTLANDVAKQLINVGHSAVVVQMDGFHLYRSQLDKLPNPAEAHRRRGAPFTFDSRALYRLVKRLHDQPPEAPDILAPSFDHAAKDPVQDAVSIPASTRFVIIEGLYMHLSIEPWDEMAHLFDERWFIDCPLEISIHRLAKRHVLTGVAASEEAALERIYGSDVRNAALVFENRVDATLELNV
ncbi:putative kinase [Chytriomyces hyalinus]|nr:putative kinase [Chytriomyces hyalinus]